MTSGFLLASSARIDLIISLTIATGYGANDESCRYGGCVAALLLVPGLAANYGRAAVCVV